LPLEPEGAVRIIPRPFWRPAFFNLDRTARSHRLEA
jgi:hypothetical protein